MKVAVLIVDRANYGRMKPVMLALKDKENIELQVICAGTMVLGRFGKVEKIVEDDGFEITSRVFMELEGSSPVTMAKSIGIGINEFTHELYRLKPDVLLVIGDRYETLGAVIAAAYMNICIAHIQGGEVSGSIDECARHSISKFAHYHFPATQRAGEYLVRMGENPKRVFSLGCPVADVIAGQDLSLPEGVFDKGIGKAILQGKEYFLVVFHPVTTSYGKEVEEVEELLVAIEKLDKQTVWLWPNIDAGSDYISKKLRQHREKYGDKNIRFVKNFTPENFQKVLGNALCAIGNSSSFVRDTTFTGTPVVLVGDRQFGREIGENTLKVECNEKSIIHAVSKQMEHGRFAPSKLYGEPGAGKKIADQIAKIEPITKKYLNYIFDE